MEQQVRQNCGGGGAATGMTEGEEGNVQTGSQQGMRRTIVTEEGNRTTSQVTQDGKDPALNMTGSGGTNGGSQYAQRAETTESIAGMEVSSPPVEQATNIGRSGTLMATSDNGSSLTPQSGSAADNSVTEDSREGGEGGGINPGNGISIDWTRTRLAGSPPQMQPTQVGCSLGTLAAAGGPVGPLWPDGFHPSCPPTGNNGIQRSGNTSAMHSEPDASVSQMSSQGNWSWTCPNQPDQRTEMVTFGGNFNPPYASQPAARLGGVTGGWNNGNRQVTQRNVGIEPSRMTRQTIAGETRRKRNRLDGQNAGSGFGDSGAGEALNMLLDNVDVLIKSGQRNTALKELVENSAKHVASEVAKLLTTVVQKQEENGYLLQQVVQLQAMIIEGKRGGVATYAEVARQGPAKDILEGKRLPGTYLPPTIKMAPAEKTVIIRTENGDGLVTKQQQATFRNKLKEAIGEELAGEISAVRPTRSGGYAIIAASERVRDQVAETVEKNVEISEGRVIRPKKRMARMLCRTPPEIPPSEFIRLMYNKHNPELQRVPVGSRSGSINVTRLGWVFTLSTAEVLACNAQGGKIRHSFGLEAILEEFIPIQQCYHCCCFGHEAKDCQTRKPKCRLCGKDGHSGRSCPQKDDRRVWRCYNCARHNELKGTKLPVDHAAAQLHRCPIAQREKEIRREQLRAAGVYVTPTPVESLPLEVPREGGEKSRRYDAGNKSNMDGSARETPGGPRTRSRVEMRKSMADDNKIQRQRGNYRGSSSEPAPRAVRPSGATKGRGKGGQGKVRWGDMEDSSERGEGGEWKIVRGRGRRGGAQRARGTVRTPLESRAVRSPSEGLSTPGVTVRVWSETEEDDLDL